MSSTRCAPFWAESPSILWEEAKDFFPFHSKAQACTSTALNSFTRFGIYLGIILAVLYRSGAYIGISIGIAAISVAAYYGMKQKGVIREGYTDVVTPTLFGNTSRNIVGGVDVADKVINDVIGSQDRTLPSGPNPFMNVLINEIKDNPTRPSAMTVDTPEMGRRFSDEFQTRMYGDPTDVFQHTQNQRTWVVQPSTSIPNDQGSFANWLYRVPGRTCKEGNNAVCHSGTEGGQIPWLAMP
jgi:hypothetical protein